MKDALNELYAQMNEIAVKYRCILDNEGIQGESGSGLVKIHGNGNGKIDSVEIDNQLFEGATIEITKKLLSSLFISALNDFDNKVNARWKEIDEIYLKEIQEEAKLYGFGKDTKGFDNHLPLLKKEKLS